MKKLILFITIFSFLSASDLIINAENNDSLPRHFRTSMTVLNDPSVSAHGLWQLRASASGQFSENGLKAIAHMVPSQKILFVDLRQESHGFRNGTAISWHTENNWINVGKSRDEILKEEQRLLSTVGGITEEELVLRHGFQYLRILVTDHQRMGDAEVDRFVNTLQALPSDVWVHFHCSAGKGRATLGMVMYDIMCNGDDVTLKDILVRQGLIGGKDFSIEPQESWKRQLQLERVAFLEQFYDYWLETHGEINWLDWVGKY